ncbi:VRR-NUC domain-containing protein [Gordonibacter sp.]|uniref:VRR-NUC domain-containing protein n=1 Tax=Gordonibacter sp. TaxID=1968902 RepID=UPI002FC9D214
MRLERDIEAAFRRDGERLGALVLKFASPGTSGVPDRIVVFPDGCVGMVELKAPGKRPRPLQVRMFAKLERLGCPVVVIDSLAGVDAYWARNASHLIGGAR